MLGVMLLFVGSVMLINGMGGLGKVEAKSMAVMNFLVGGLGLIATLIQLVRAESPADFFGIGAFLLFTFTYLYVAICIWLDLDMRAFGWYCFFVALTTIPYSLVSFQTDDPRFGVFWLIWGSMWFMFYLSNVPQKDLGKLLPYSVITIGVCTCWIPGLLMLTDRW